MKRGAPVNMPQSITIEMDGTPYRATYTVVNGLLTLHSSFGSGAGMLGGLSRFQLATNLFNSQLREAKARGLLE